MCGLRKITENLICITFMKNEYLHMVDFIQEAHIFCLPECRTKEDKLVLELQEKSNLRTGMELEALIK